MSAEATSLETKARPWGLILVEGILAVVIGAILLWAPAKPRLIPTSPGGGSGPLLGHHGYHDPRPHVPDHTAWGWKLFMGVISIIAGAYVLMYPVAAGLALPKIFVLVLGLSGIFQGILMIIMAFKGGGWGIGILGALMLLLGIYLTANWSMLGMGLAFLWAAAMTAIIGGIALIFIAFKEICLTPLTP